MSVNTTFGIAPKRLDRHDANARHDAHPSFLFTPNQPGLINYARKDLRKSKNDKWNVWLEVAPAQARSGNILARDSARISQHDAVCCGVGTRDH